MKPIKTAIRKILSTAGYTVHRVGEAETARVHFENFVNLTHAYEHHLNRRNPEAGLPRNPLRPRLLGRLLGTPPAEAYFIVQALARCSGVDGDVCEFGVAQGETSALIANEIAAGRKVLHLFDSFEGLPSPTDKDKLKDDIFSLGSMEAYAGTMACPEDLVRSRLKAVSFPTDRFVIHRGFFEQIVRTDEGLPSRVSFAYVDFDFYAPIKAALEFLHPRMDPGAIVIVDDYDFFSSGAKAAVDEFVAERNSEGGAYQCVVPDPELGHFAVLERVGVTVR